MKAKESVINFIKKYKVVTAAVFVTSIITAALFDIEKIWTPKWYEALIIFSFIAVGTFLVDKVFAVYENEIRAKVPDRRFLAARIISYIVVVLLQYLLYRLTINLLMRSEIIRMGSDYTNFDTYAAMGYSVVVVNAIFASLISYFVIREKQISIKDYLLKLFINLLCVFLVVCVVLVGFMVLYLICETLLGTIPYYIISRIIIFTINMLSTMGLFISIENVEGEHSLFSKILVRYIMQIMVFIGFIIFYIYLIKIIIKHELPSNQVYLVCVTLFALGLPVSLMSLAIDEESIYSKAIKYLPVAFIPAFILQIISIGLRVNQHGLTPIRYIGIVVIIFEATYIVQYILAEILKSKKVKLENIFLSACIIMLIAFFVPLINVYDFPQIYNNLLGK